MIDAFAFILIGVVIGVLLTTAAFHALNKWM